MHTPVQTQGKILKAYGHQPFHMPGLLTLPCPNACPALS